MTHMQIAIDGPAGAGKSTIAKAVANRLNILYLDTGAMYRALALYALEQGIDPNDEAGVAGILPTANITVQYCGGTQRTLLNGRDVTGMIRTPAVSKGASDIGVHPAVRRKQVELAQQVAASIPVVMDGRDIGTAVLPNAPHKFYITASPEVRAQRRLLEMRARGEDADLKTLTADIIARDTTDSTRACFPLCRAPGAVELDTTNMTIEESIQAVLRAIGKD